MYFEYSDLGTGSIACMYATPTHLYTEISRVMQEREREFWARAFGHAVRMGFNYTDGVV